MSILLRHWVFRHSSFQQSLGISSFVILLGISSFVIAEDWHLTDWSSRAMVEIAEPVTGVDTAAVKVLCQGRAKTDGSDFRVLNEAGQPVPFQLTFHNASRYALLSFRAENAQAGQRFYVYYGNEGVERAAEQVVVNDKPGSGPPQGSWTPRAGLSLTTMQRPEAENPETVEQLTELIAGSNEKYGGRYQRRVSDGHNPFGPSDYYISVYRGWIDIPEAGTYKLCTASNEASFSFLDGKELIHWPGRHTSERGLRGEMNAEVELTAGLHFLEYYHEEVMLQQVAFLGWSTPGSPAGHFSAIPESVYTVPHSASVVRYESHQGALPYFEPDILDSIWPADRHEGQYTRVRFSVDDPKAFPDGTTYLWSFGDGESTTGAECEHVYLSLGRYDVTLTAENPGGKTSSSWPLEIYEIQHVTDDIKQGRPPEYAEIAAKYDPATLDAANLKELAHLYAEGDRPQDALRVGQIFVDRFSDTNPEMLPRVRRLMALCALATGDEGVDGAIANFQASITEATPPVEKIDSLAQLILLLGIERKQPDKTMGLLAQVEETTKNSVVDDEVKAAYRRAINAAGDVLLWNGNRAEARDFYKRVEVIRGKFIPEQVRSARVGAYPRAIREYLAAGDYDAALDIVDQWEDQFATEKVKGHTFFWRGTILAERHLYRDAARYLARSLGLATGAGFETEARWRLAESLEKLDKKKESEAELAKLVATGLNDEFVEAARQKLEALKK
ncbi:MAG: PKD domain-containing protein [Planctomycetota bacterium]|nr:PKD domain-containing protein [Planctomycetota bacterium]